MNRATMQMAQDYLGRIKELEKENAELKKKCYKKAVKDYCKLEKENAELKADNDARKFAMAMSEKVEKQLREQIEKLKADLNDAIESASKWYVGDPVYSMLVDIYNDNFEITKGVSN